MISCFKTENTIYVSLFVTWGAIEASLICGTEWVLFSEELHKDYDAI